MGPLAPIIAGGVFDIGKRLIDKFFPDPEKAAEAQLKLAQMHQTGELAYLAAETDIAKLQISTNQEEAKHESVFIAGWRPHIGWVCGFAFSYNFLLQPFLVFLIHAFGTPDAIARIAQLPSLDWAQMMPVLFGMLGIGGYRTYEKIKGKTRSNRTRFSDQ